MSGKKSFGVEARNFKSFGKEAAGLAHIYPVNVIIGRNNSGKSALIDLLAIATGAMKIDSSHHHKGNVPELIYHTTISEQDIEKVFSISLSGGVVPINHRAYGMRWLNKPFSYSLKNGRRSFLSIDPEFDTPKAYHAFKQPLTDQIRSPFTGLRCRRILSDRDIQFEGDMNQNDPNVAENGQGATNIIQHFYNKTHRRRDAIEKDLLNALNEIFNPDATFDEIIVRQMKENNNWEIYLREESKGLIALSNSGSGLKTVLLVLINLILVPEVENLKLEDYIFCFEELENNLHPGLQRRLFTYLRRRAVSDQCTIVTTTHSNIVIDLFSKDDEAQIIHVKHDGDSAKAKKVQTYIENNGVLDDLDVRASDLLQSNCIVWLEGPSDRTYFNTWIHLASNGELKEGAHYQCVFYGGRLLAHLSSVFDSDEDEINILRVNRNAILLMDSDMKKPRARLNKTKMRMKSEIKNADGLCWVTKGREVENYIPFSAIQSMFPNKQGFKTVGKYENFADYLNKIEKGSGNKFLGNKVGFADSICSFITQENYDQQMDLNEMMKKIINQIRKWNNI